MSLTRLTLTNFRNYTEAELTPSQDFVVLTGANGAGKTNVLEAISLFAPGRGLRGAPLGEMARQNAAKETGGAGGFGVSAALLPSPLQGRGRANADDNRRRLGEGAFSNTPITVPLSPTLSPEGEREVNLGTGTLATAPERRIVRINGATAAATALSEWLSLIWITPAMDRLFTDTPGGRRRFLDRLVLALHPGHAHHSTRYDAAMRQRNRLLSEDHPDASWLDALEVAMGAHGAEITSARISVVKKLNEVIEVSADSHFPQSRLTLANATNGENLRTRLAASRAAHAAAGRTLIGPHTEDMSVEYVAKAQPAARCSTGEQKALLLGIVLAHADLVAAQVQRRPILLLDEVAAHLDPSRRAALFERLAAGGGQVWMTGTERGLFDGLSAASWFTINEGTVQQN